MIHRGCRERAASCSLVSVVVLLVMATEGLRSPPWPVSSSPKPALQRWAAPDPTLAGHVATHNNSVCVCGSTNVDLIVSSGPRFPRAGETIIFDDAQQCFGGKGANQAVQAALLGADVEMVAKVGDDDFGTSMLDNFAAKRVKSGFVSKAEKIPSGCAFITVAEGTNTIVIVPGANARLSVQDVNDASEQISRCDVLLCQMEVPPATTLKALELCSETAVSILNTAPIPSNGVPDDLLRAADIVCANEVELELLAGAKADTVETAARAAGVLRRTKNITCILATLGHNGCLLSTDKCAVHVPAEKVDVVADTSGAGDSFLGALAAFLAAGRPIVAAIRDANKVAALSVQASGTQPSYPDVRGLVDRYPDAFAAEETRRDDDASSSATDRTALRYLGSPDAGLILSAQALDAVAPDTILSLQPDGTLVPFDSSAEA